MSTYQELLQGLTCPGCAYPLAEASYPPGMQPPRAGDLIICFNCGSLAIFEDDARTVRPLTTADRFRAACANLARLEHSELVQRAIRARGPIWPKRGEGVAG